MGHPHSTHWGPTAFTGDPRGLGPTDCGHRPGKISCAARSHDAPLPHGPSTCSHEAQCSATAAVLQLNGKGMKSGSPSPQFHCKLSEDPSGHFLACTRTRALWRLGVHQSTPQAPWFVTSVSLLPSQPRVQGQRQVRPRGRAAHLPSRSLSLLCSKIENLNLLPS